MRVFGQILVSQQTPLAYDPEIGQCSSARRQPASPQLAWLRNIPCHMENLKHMLLQIQMSQEAAMAGFVRTILNLLGAPAGAVVLDSQAPVCHGHAQLTHGKLASEC